jgi:hypothetical protein
MVLGAQKDPCVRGQLSRVVKRRELVDVAPDESAPDQIVREVRILR